MKKKSLNNVIDKLIAIEHTRSEGNSFDLIKLNSLKQRLSDDKFKITVVGEFSVGKSTFLNAIVGKKLLAARRKETTASITHITNAIGTLKSKVDTFDVHFSDDKKSRSFALENITELERYSVKSDEIDVVNEISHINVFTDFNVSTPFSLVDTPGLNGMAPGHKEITYRQIKESDACILLVGVKGMSKSNDDLLRFLERENIKVLLVVNQIDSVNESEGETVNSKVAEIDSYLNEKFKQLNFESFPISAIDELEIKQGKRNNSRYHHYFEELENRLKKVYLDIESYREAKYTKHFCSIKSDINNSIDVEIKQISSELNSEECNVKSKKVKLEKRDRDRQELIRRNLKKDLSQCQERLVGDWVENHQNDVVEKVKASLRGYHTSAMFLAKRDKIRVDIIQIISAGYNDFAKRVIKPSLDKVIDASILRVNSYFNLTNIAFNGFIINVESVKTDSIDNVMHSIETKIDKENRQLVQINNQINILDNTIRSSKSTVLQNERKRDELNRRVKANTNLFHSSNAKLGQRPEPRKVYKKERSWVFWEKEVYSHTDYSNTEAWMRNKQQIENDYKTKKSNIERMYNSIQSNLINLSRQIAQNKRKLGQSEEDKNECIHRISSHETELANKSRMNEAKTLKTLNAAVIKEVGLYLEKIVTDTIQSTIESHRLKIEEVLLKYYSKNHQTKQVELELQLKQLNNGQLGLRVNTLKDLTTKINRVN